MLQQHIEIRTRTKHKQSNELML